LDIIRTNLDKPWDWPLLSRSTVITWDFIKENPGKPWDWLGVSINPNITWEIIEDNSDKPWIWCDASLIPTIFDIPEKRARQYFAVRKIWRYWFKAITDPEYTICKKRLRREFAEY
jgi:hypothetical protein